MTWNFQYLLTRPNSHQLDWTRISLQQKIFSLYFCSLPCFTTVHWNVHDCLVILILWKWNYTNGILVLCWNFWNMAKLRINEYETKCRGSYWSVAMVWRQNKLLVIIHFQFLYLNNELVTLSRVTIFLVNATQRKGLPHYRIAVL